VEPSSLQHPHSSPAPTKEWRIPGYYFLEKTFQRFSATEKVAFTICGAIAAVSGLLLLYSLSHSFEVQVPARGGSITEGVVGIPRFINPLLALSDTDRDLTTLTYAGLVALEGDTIVPDIASDYTVSADGLQYTFTLRDDARFHDGTPVTADDVEFTIQKAQDPALKSPRRAAWEGVTIEKNRPASHSFYSQATICSFS
jgi:ABC-type transport system substrate-binding protein